jgi:WD40 repeat protein
MSNANRNVFAYSDAQNNVYINSYNGINMHKIANKKAVEAIAVGVGSDRLAVATQNEAGKSVINLYQHNWKGLKDVLPLVGHKEKVENLIFSEKDAKLLSCTEEEIIVWDTESGKILHRFVPKIANPIANARKVAVADAANIIAYAGYSKIIVADLDNKTSTEIKLGALPNDFKFSSDGQFLYTAHKGVFIKYEAATGEVVEEIDVNEPNSFCHLSPNSLYALLISTEDNLLQVIHLDWQN